MPAQKRQIQSSQTSKARAHKTVALEKLNPRFSSMADHVVDPGHCKANLAPSLCPSRAGAVTFPIIVDVTGLSDFCVVAQPDIMKPLMITHKGSVPESNDPYSGTMDKPLSGYDAVLEGTRGCIIESTTVGGRPAIPLSSAAGCTTTAAVAVTDGDFSSYDVVMEYWNGVAWILMGNVLVQTGGNTGVIAPGFAYPIGATHVAFAITPTGVVHGGSGTAHGTFNINIASGLATCQDITFGASNENVFDVFVPEWEKVLSVSDKVSIPYMDCLVTYQGSTLNNEGAIAACACSEELDPLSGSYYSRVASRPFDAYEGRLASQGETDGGAHWHLLHDDIRAYSLSRSEELITGPRGYIAIKGMDDSQTVRIMVHITLNYYTIDPAFNMVFQPPWGETDLLLYTLRTQVPVVSSNDRHLDKLFKLAKKKAVQATRWAIENPEKAAAMAMAAGEFAGALLV